jgi:hypothetical protein
MDIELILVIGFSVLGFLSFISIIIAISSNISTKKNKEEIHEDNDIGKLELARLLLSTENCVEKIDNILDIKIKAAADMYNILILSTDENQYINTTQIDEMSNYIEETVFRNFTTSMRIITGLIYDVSSDKKIKDIIKVRTKIYMINFVMEYNKLIDEGE